MLAILNESRPWNCQKLVSVIVLHINNILCPMETNICRPWAPLCFLMLLLFGFMYEFVEAFKVAGGLISGSTNLYIGVSNFKFYVLAWIFRKFSAY